jgi:putative transposase
VRAVCDLKAHFSLAVLLEIAGLARSTFFYHQARQPAPGPHAVLNEAIRAIFTRAKGRYGHRRIHRALRAAGWHVAKKTVLKQMRHLGLACQVRRRKRYGSYRGAIGATAPNRLERAFSASAPNQKWVTDITEFRIGADKLYLSPVMDLFDRQIIAYTVGHAPTLSLTTNALRTALTQLRPGETPLVHSDQGFHYRHRTWQALLTATGAVPSMSRKGNCLDNAVIESFFGHLKSELHPHQFSTVDALTTALHDYIDWYNHDRTSATLTGLSPVDYRTQAVVV